MAPAIAGEPDEATIEICKRWVMHGYFDKNAQLIAAAEKKNMAFALKTLIFLLDQQSSTTSDAAGPSVAEPSSPTSTPNTTGFVTPNTHLTPEGESAVKASAIELARQYPTVQELRDYFVELKNSFVTMRQEGEGQAKKEVEVMEDTSYYANTSPFQEGVELDWSKSDASPTGTSPGNSAVNSAFTRHRPRTGRYYGNSDSSFVPGTHQAPVGLVAPGLKSSEDSGPVQKGTKTRSLNNCPSKFHFKRMQQIAHKEKTRHFELELRDLQSSSPNKMDWERSANVLKRLWLTAKTAVEHVDLKFDGCTHDETVFLDSVTNQTCPMPCLQVSLCTDHEGQTRLEFTDCTTNNFAHAAGTALFALFDYNDGYKLLEYVLNNVLDDTFMDKETQQEIMSNTETDLLSTVLPQLCKTYEAAVKAESAPRQALQELAEAKAVFVIGQVNVDSGPQDSTSRSNIERMHENFYSRMLKSPDTNSTHAVRPTISSTSSEYKTVVQIWSPSYLASNVGRFFDIARDFCTDGRSVFEAANVLSKTETHDLLCRSLLLQETGTRDDALLPYVSPYCPLMFVESVFDYTIKSDTSVEDTSHPDTMTTEGTRAGLTPYKESDEMDVPEDVFPKEHLQIEYDKNLEQYEKSRSFFTSAVYHATYVKELIRRLTRTGTFVYTASVDRNVLIDKLQHLSQTLDRLVNHMKFNMMQMTLCGEGLAVLTVLQALHSSIKNLIESLEGRKPEEEEEEEEILKQAETRFALSRYFCAWLDVFLGMLSIGVPNTQCNDIWDADKDVLIKDLRSLIFSSNKSVPAEDDEDFVKNVQYPEECTYEYSSTVQETYKKIQRDVQHARSFHKRTIQNTAVLLTQQASVGDARYMFVGLDAINDGRRISLDTVSYALQNWLEQSLCVHMHSKRVFLDCVRKTGDTAIVESGLTSTMLKAHSLPNVTFLHDQWAQYQDIALKKEGLDLSMIRITRCAFQAMFSSALVLAYSTIINEIEDLKEDKERNHGFAFQNILDQHTMLCVYAYQASALSISMQLQQGANNVLNVYAQQQNASATVISHIAGMQNSVMTFVPVCVFQQHKLDTMDTDILKDTYASQSTLPYPKSSVYYAGMYDVVKQVFSEKSTFPEYAKPEVYKTAGALVGNLLFSLLVVDGHNSFIFDDGPPIDIKKFSPDRSLKSFCTFENVVCAALSCINKRYKHECLPLHHEHDIFEHPDKVLRVHTACKRIFAAAVGAPPCKTTPLSWEEHRSFESFCQTAVCLVQRRLEAASYVSLKSTSSNVDEPTLSRFRIAASVAAVHVVSCVVGERYGQKAMLDNCFDNNFVESHGSVRNALMSCVDQRAVVPVYMRGCDIRLLCDVNCEETGRVDILTRDAVAEARCPHSMRTERVEKYEALVACLGLDTYVTTHGAGVLQMYVAWDGLFTGCKLVNASNLRFVMPSNALLVTTASTFFEQQLILEKLGRDIETAGATDCSSFFTEGVQFVTLDGDLTRVRGALVHKPQAEKLGLCIEGIRAGAVFAVHGTTMFKVFSGEGMALDLSKKMLEPLKLVHEETNAEQDLLGGLYTSTACTFDDSWTNAVQARSAVSVFASSLKSGSSESLTDACLEFTANRDVVRLVRSMFFMDKTAQMFIEISKQPGEVADGVVSKPEDAEAVDACPDRSIPISGFTATTTAGIDQIEQFITRLSANGFNHHEVMTQEDIANLMLKIATQGTTTDDLDEETINSLNSLIETFKQAVSFKDEELEVFSPESQFAKSVVNIIRKANITADDTSTKALDPPDAALAVTRPRPNRSPSRRRPEMNETPLSNKTPLSNWEKHINGVLHIFSGVFFDLGVYVTGEDGLQGWGDKLVSPSRNTTATFDYDEFKKKFLDGRGGWTPSLAYQLASAALHSKDTTWTAFSALKQSNISWFPTFFTSESNDFTWFFRHIQCFVGSTTLVMTIERILLRLNNVLNTQLVPLACLALLFVLSYFKPDFLPDHVKMISTVAVSSLFAIRKDASLKSMNNLQTRKRIDEAYNKVAFLYFLRYRIYMLIKHGTSIDADMRKTLTKLRTYVNKFSPTVDDNMTSSDVVSAVKGDVLEMIDYILNSLKSGIKEKLVRHYVLQENKQDVLFMKFVKQMETVTEATTLKEHLMKLKPTSNPGSNTESNEGDVENAVNSLKHYLEKTNQLRDNTSRYDLMTDIYYENGLSVVNWQMGTVLLLVAYKCIQFHTELTKLGVDMSLMWAVISAVFVKATKFGGRGVRTLRPNLNVWNKVHVVTNVNPRPVSEVDPTAVLVQFPLFHVVVNELCTKRIIFTDRVRQTSLLFGKNIFEMCTKYPSQLKMIAGAFKPIILHFMVSMALRYIYFQSIWAQDNPSSCEEWQETFDFIGLNKEYKEYKNFFFPCQEKFEKICKDGDCPYFDESAANIVLWFSVLTTFTTTKFSNWPKYLFLTLVPTAIMTQLHSSYIDIILKKGCDYGNLGLWNDTYKFVEKVLLGVSAVMRPKPGSPLQAILKEVARAFSIEHLVDLMHNSMLMQSGGGVASMALYSKLRDSLEFDMIHYVTLGVSVARSHLVSHWSVSLPNVVSQIASLASFIPEIAATDQLGLVYQAYTWFNYVCPSFGISTFMVKLAHSFVAMPNGGLFNSPYSRNIYGHNGGVSTVKLWFGDSSNALTRMFSNSLHLQMVYAGLDPMARVVGMDNSQAADNNQLTQKAVVNMLGKGYAFDEGITSFSEFIITRHFLNLYINSGESLLLDSSNAYKESPPTPGSTSSTGAEACKSINFGGTQNTSTAVGGMHFAPEAQTTAFTNVDDKAPGQRPLYTDGLPRVSAACLTFYFVDSLTIYVGAAVFGILKAVTSTDGNCGKPHFPLSSTSVGVPAATKIEPDEPNKELFYRDRVWNTFTKAGIDGLKEAVKRSGKFEQSVRVDGVTKTNTEINIDALENFFEQETTFDQRVLCLNTDWFKEIHQTSTATSVQSDQIPTSTKAECFKSAINECSYRLSMTTLFHGVVQRAWAQYPSNVSDVPIAEETKFRKSVKVVSAVCFVLKYIYLQNVVDPNFPNLSGAKTNLEGMAKLTEPEEKNVTTTFDLLYTHYNQKDQNDFKTLMTNVLGNSSQFFKFLESMFGGSTAFDKLKELNKRSQLLNLLESMFEGSTAFTELRKLVGDDMLETSMFKSVMKEFDKRSQLLNLLKSMFGRSTAFTKLRELVGDDKLETSMFMSVMPISSSYTDNIWEVKNKDATLFVKTIYKFLVCQRARPPLAIASQYAKHMYDEVLNKGDITQDTLQELPHILLTNQTACAVAKQSVTHFYKALSGLETAVPVGLLSSLPTGQNDALTGSVRKRQFLLQKFWEQAKIVKNEPVEEPGEIFEWTCEITDKSSADAVKNAIVTCNMCSCMLAQETQPSVVNITKLNPDESQQDVLDVPDFSKIVSTIFECVNAKRNVVVKFKIPNAHVNNTVDLPITTGPKPKLGAFNFFEDMRDPTNGVTKVYFFEPPERTPEQEASAWSPLRISKRYVQDRFDIFCGEKKETPSSSSQQDFQRALFYTLQNVITEQNPYWDGTGTNTRNDIMEKCRYTTSHSVEQAAAHYKFPTDGTALTVNTDSHLSFCTNTMDTLGNGLNASSGGPGINMMSIATQNRLFLSLWNTLNDAEPSSRELKQILFKELQTPVTSNALADLTSPQRLYELGVVKPMYAMRLKDAIFRVKDTDAEQMWNTSKNLLDVTYNVVLFILQQLYNLFAKEDESRMSIDEALHTCLSWFLTPVAQDIFNVLPLATFPMQLGPSTTALRKLVTTVCNLCINDFQIWDVRTWDLPTFLFALQIFYAVLRCGDDYVVRYHKAIGNATTLMRKEAQKNVDALTRIMKTVVETTYKASPKTPFRKYILNSLLCALVAESLTVLLSGRVASAGQENLTSKIPKWILTRASEGGVLQHTINAAINAAINVALGRFFFDFNNLPLSFLQIFWGYSVHAKATPMLTDIKNSSPNFIKTDWSFVDMYKIPYGNGLLQQFDLVRDLGITQEYNALRQTSASWHTFLPQEFRNYRFIDVPAMYLWLGHEAQQNLDQLLTTLPEEQRSKLFTALMVLITNNYNILVGNRLFTNMSYNDQLSTLLQLTPFINDKLKTTDGFFDIVLQKDTSVQTTGDFEDLAPESSEVYEASYETVILNNILTNVSNSISDFYNMIQQAFSNSTSEQPIPKPATPKPSPPPTTPEPSPPPTTPEPPAASKPTSSLKSTLQTLYTKRGSQLETFLEPLDIPETADMYTYSVLSIKIPYILDKVQKQMKLFNETNETAVQLYLEDLAFVQPNWPNDISKFEDLYMPTVDMTTVDRKIQDNTDQKLQEITKTQYGSTSQYTAANPGVDRMNEYMLKYFYEKDNKEEETSALTFLSQYFGFKGEESTKEPLINPFFSELNAALKKVRKSGTDAVTYLEDARLKHIFILKQLKTLQSMSGAHTELHGLYEIWQGGDFEQTSTKSTFPDDTVQQKIQQLQELLQQTAKQKAELLLLPDTLFEGLTTLKTNITTAANEYPMEADYKTEIFDIFVPKKPSTSQRPDVVDQIIAHLGDEYTDALETTLRGLSRFGFADGFLQALAVFIRYHNSVGDILYQLKIRQGEEMRLQSSIDECLRETVGTAAPWLYALIDILKGEKTTDSADCSDNLPLKEFGTIQVGGRQNHVYIFNDMNEQGTCASPSRETTVRIGIDDQNVTTLLSSFFTADLPYPNTLDNDYRLFGEGRIFKIEFSDDTQKQQLVIDVSKAHAYILAFFRTNSVSKIMNIFKTEIKHTESVSTESDTGDQNTSTPISTLSLPQFSYKTDAMFKLYHAVGMAALGAVKFVHGFLQQVWLINLCFDRLRLYLGTEENIESLMMYAAAAVMTVGGTRTQSSSLVNYATIVGTGSVWKMLTSLYYRSVQQPAASGSVWNKLKCVEPKKESSTPQTIDPQLQVRLFPSTDTTMFDAVRQLHCTSNDNGIDFDALTFERIYRFDFVVRVLMRRTKFMLSRLGDKPKQYRQLDRFLGLAIPSTVDAYIADDIDVVLMSNRAQEDFTIDLVEHTKSVGGLSFNSKTDNVKEMYLQSKFESLFTGEEFGYQTDSNRRFDPLEKVVSERENTMVREAVEQVLGDTMKSNTHGHAIVPDSTETLRCSDILRCSLSNMAFESRNAYWKSMQFIMHNTRAGERGSKFTELEWEPGEAGSPAMRRNRAQNPSFYEPRDCDKLRVCAAADIFSNRLTVDHIIFAILVNKVVHTRRRLEQVEPVKKDGNVALNMLATDLVCSKCDTDDYKYVLRCRALTIIGSIMCLPRKSVEQENDSYNNTMFVYAADSEGKTNRMQLFYKMQKACNPEDSEYNGVCSLLAFVPYNNYTTYDARYPAKTKFDAYDKEKMAEASKITYEYLHKNQTQTTRPTNMTQQEFEKAIGRQKDYKYHPLFLSNYDWTTNEYCLPS